MKKEILSLLVLLSLALCLNHAVADQFINNCPMPDNMKIVEPEKNGAPQKLALLSGIWEGNWGAMSVLFIVEKINRKEAVVIYSCSGRQMARGASIPANYFRKTCPVEPGQDGNYRIIMALSQGTNKLIQTDDPKYLRVTREGFSGLSTETKDSIFRKREMR